MTAKKINIQFEDAFDITHQEGSLAMSINIEAVNTPLVIIILEQESDLDILFEKEYSIRFEAPPSFLLGKQSMARRIQNYYDEVEITPETDKQLDELYDYAENHYFDRFFSGQDIGEVFIGKNEESHEISCFEKSKPFQYEICIDQFFSCLSNVKKTGL